MTAALCLPDVPGAAERTAPVGSHAALWQGILAELERDPSISRASFASWISGAQLLHVAADEAVIGAQHSFALEKLERTFRGAFEGAIRRQLGNPSVRVRFALARGGAANREPRDTPAVRPLPLKAPAKDQQRALSLGEAKGLPSNPLWTFETFDVGRGNHFAHAAAYAVADNPSFAYNPLVLHGGAGAGKSHLLHAIGQRVLASRPGAAVAYASGSALAAELSGAAGNSALLAAARGRYTRADVFLLDDVQTLPPAHTPDGAAVQREVAQLLTALLRADRQVVVAADGPPRTLEHLDEALRTVLQRGLVAEVGPRQPSVAVPPAAPPVALAARSAAPAGPPAPIAPPAGAIPGLPRRRAVPEDVLRAVAAYYGVPADALRAKRRDKEAVTPRQVAMYLLREETGLSLSDVGARLGGRDHTTVLHGCEKIAALLTHDHRLYDDVAAIRHQLGVPPTETGARASSSGGAAAAAAAP